MFKILFNEVKNLSNVPSNTDFGLDNLNSLDNGTYILYNGICFAVKVYINEDKSRDTTIEMYTKNEKDELYMICGVRLSTQLLDKNTEYNFSFNCPKDKSNNSSAYIYDKQKNLPNAFRMSWSDRSYLDNKFGRVIVNYDTMTEEFLFQCSVGYDYNFDIQLAKAIYDTIRESEFHYGVCWINQRHGDVDKFNKYFPVLKGIIDHVIKEKLKCN